MKTSDFVKYSCPKCGHFETTRLEDDSMVGRTMYYIKCNNCGWETQRFFYVVSAELYWIDERNVQ